MAGSYGSETLHDGRYRLSFTVGGLLAAQGRIIASLFVNNGYLDNSERADGADSQNDNIACGQNVRENLYKDDAQKEDTREQEIGKRILLVRQQALDDNVLYIRTQSANVRMVSEVLKRLSTLSDQEIQFLADPDTMADDYRALMWVAMCRYYALVGQFAHEVLRDHYLLGMTTVTRNDYDRFILDKAMWHQELEELSSTTAAKLRSNLFKAMMEAGLIEQHSDTLLPSLLSRSVTGILEKRPESFLYFPLREC